MSRETDWFQSSQVGNDRSRHDKVVEARPLIWLTIIVILLVAPILLFGCSSQVKVVAQVCELKYLGKAEDGNPVFLQACESVKQFKADQREAPAL